MGPWPNQPQELVSRKKMDNNCSRQFFPQRYSTMSTDLVQVALYTFVSPLASSIMAPGLPDVAIKFNITNPTILALTLSIFLLSFAIGPLFAAPLSEVYGRLWVRCPLFRDPSAWSNSRSSTWRIFSSSCSILAVLYHVTLHLSSSFGF